VIVLSRYSLEPLRNDEEFILYRGWCKEDTSRFLLLLLPIAEYPAPESPKRLEYEYSLREELDSAWAVRPVEIPRRSDRPVLLLDDPGGVPFDHLLSHPLDLALLYVWLLTLRPRSANCISAALSIRTSSRRTFWWALQAARFG
jgi:hypothetical protein